MTKVDTLLKEEEDLYLFCASGLEAIPSSCSAVSLVAHRADKTFAYSSNTPALLVLGLVLLLLG